MHILNKAINHSQCNINLYIYKKFYNYHVSINKINFVQVHVHFYL